MSKAEVHTPTSDNESLLNDYTTLYNTVDSFDNPDHIEIQKEYFQSSFAFPNINLSEDLLLVRNNVGTLIASGSIFTDNNPLRTSRLMIQVHPQCRLQGIGSEILNQLLQKGFERGSKEFVCRFPSFRPYIAPFLEKHGFSLDSTRLKMEYQLSNPVVVFPLPLGLTIRAMNIKKELALWAELQNEIFKDFPSYEFVTTETLTSVINHSTFDSHLIILAKYFSEPIGYCLGLSLNSSNRGKILRIEGIGVLPEYRRRGYGSALISEILNRACIKKHASAELVVQNTNKPAISLYEKFGFKERYSHLLYKRVVVG